MFKIQKGESLKVQGIKILLYGDPSTGKTSTALTAEKPILLDFDNGAHRSEFKFNKDIVRIDSWQEIDSELHNLANTFKPYKTIIIDTVDTCLKYIRQYIEDNDTKLKRNQLQMYGKMKDTFVNFLYRITSLNKDVILIAHSNTEEQNGITKTMPKVTGGSKAEIKEVADFMGYMYFQNNKRTLNFTPTDFNDGKNSANLPILSLPNFNADPDYFAGVIAKMRDSLIADTKQQEESLKKIEKYRELISNSTQENFNDLVQELRKLKKYEVSQLAELVISQAMDLEMTKDKDGNYVIATGEEVFADD